MSEVFIDKIKDEVWVKSDGEVTKANIVGSKPSPDIAVIPTKEQLDSVALSEAEKLLKEKIQDIKEKYELFTMGVIDQAKFDLKKAEYAPLKADYDTKKSK